MSLYTVTKVKDLISNTEMNEPKLNGRGASVYTPTELAIRAIESNGEVKIKDIGKDNIWENKDRFIAKKGYGVEFRLLTGCWWRTSPVEKVEVLGSGRFNLYTINSVYLIEEVK